MKVPLGSCQDGQGPAFFQSGRLRPAVTIWIFLGQIVTRFGFVAAAAAAAAATIGLWVALQVLRGEGHDFREASRANLVGPVWICQQGSTYGGDFELVAL